MGVVEMKDVRVLFVCLGNICRSPTAQGVFEAQVRQAGLAKQIKIDSAGTSDWHIGAAPDSRTVKAAKKRDYDLSSLRGRQALPEDFQHFDYILAMDADNLAELNKIKPRNYSGHLGLFLDFAKAFEESNVPDPYYGGSQGFDLVLDLIENAGEGLLEHIRSHASQ